MLASEKVYADRQKNSPADYLLYLMHLKTYDFARPYCQGKRVLDVGCGRGYGVCRIAPDCAEVVGVDIDADATAYARENFSLANTHYQTIKPAEAESLPFDDRSFDTVISFQVIEHIFDMKAYLSEIRRVLRPGGAFLCATPDRTTRLYPLQKPWNYEHVTEFTEAKFETILSLHFDRLEIFKMGGRSDVIRIELERTKKLRRLLLPVTLPVVPDSLRVWMLRMAQSLKMGKQPMAELDLGFDLSDIHISKMSSPSLNLISVAWA